MSRTAADMTAVQKRAENPLFVATFSLEALRDRLPLAFPVPEDVPPSPKGQYRSWYRYRGYGELADPDILANLTVFQVSLRLIDFAPLRDYLADGYYVPSRKGQVPGDA